MSKCDNCGKEWEERWTIEMPAGDTAYACSPSCLVELAWQIKQAQYKLSKSKSEEVTV